MKGKYKLETLTNKLAEYFALPNGERSVPFEFWVETLKREIINKRFDIEIEKGKVVGKYEFKKGG